MEFLLSQADLSLMSVLLLKVNTLKAQSDSHHYPSTIMILEASQLLNTKILPTLSPLKANIYLKATCRWFKATTESKEVKVYLYPCIRTILQ